MAKRGKRNHFVPMYTLFEYRGDLYTTGLSASLVSLAGDLLHIFKARLPETSLTTAVAPECACSPLATIFDRKFNVAIMAEDLFALLETGLGFDAATGLASVPCWSLF